MKRRPALACVLLWIAMIAVHQAFWRWDDAALVLGFLPLGLAYHAGYCLLACGVMWGLARWAWPARLERLEDR